MTTIKEEYIQIGNQLMPAINSEVLLFILLISGNYIGELFSCGLQKSFSNNRIYKHILGFFSLYLVITTLLNTNLLTTLQYALVSFIMYCWFVIMTLTPKKYTLSIISILVFLYILNDVDAYYKFLEEREKFYLYSCSFILVIVLSFTGFYKLYNMKKNQFGSKFNLYKFIFGTNICKHYK